MLVDWEHLLAPGSEMDPVGMDFVLSFGKGGFNGKVLANRVLLIGGNPVLLALSLLRMAESGEHKTVTVVLTSESGYWPYRHFMQNGFGLLTLSNNLKRDWHSHTDYMEELSAAIKKNDLKIDFIRLDQHGIESAWRDAITNSGCAILKRNEGGWSSPDRDSLVQMFTRVLTVGANSVDFNIEDEKIGLLSKGMLLFSAPVSAKRKWDEEHVYPNLQCFGTAKMDGDRAETELIGISDCLIVSKLDFFDFDGPPVAFLFKGDRIVDEASFNR